MNYLLASKKDGQYYWRKAAHILISWAFHDGDLEIGIKDKARPALMRLTVLKDADNYQYDVESLSKLSWVFRDGHTKYRLHDTGEQLLAIMKDFDVSNVKSKPPYSTKLAELYEDPEFHTSYTELANSLDSDTPWTDVATYLAVDALETDEGPVYALHQDAIELLEAIWYHEGFEDDPEYLENIRKVQELPWVYANETCKYRLQGRSSNGVERVYSVLEGTELPNKLKR
jgi:hypothetical protein